MVGSDGRVDWLLQPALLRCPDALGIPVDDVASHQAIDAFLNQGCRSIVVATRRCSLAQPADRAPPESSATLVEPPLASAAAARTPSQEQQEQRPGSGHTQDGVELAPSNEPLPQSLAPAASSTETAVVLCAYTTPFPASLQGTSCVHFERTGAGEQQLQLGDMEAAVTRTVLPSGPTVGSLQQVLVHVFLPLLAARQAGGPGTAGGPGKPASLSELYSAAQKFAGHLEQAQRQLSSSVQLPVPQGVDLSDPVAAAKNEEALAVCEQVEEQWARIMSGTLHQEAQRVPQGRGPLAELTFWQERSAIYSSLYEQLSLPIVKTVQTVVEKGSTDHNLISSFKTQLGDLTRLTLEARDNVKFLLTLERHFKNITSGSLQSVLDTLSPMLNALRMIWIISRYYGDDVRMSALLERISHGLLDRLYSAVDVSTLFKSPSATSIKLVKTCKAIADGWYSTYMQMREKIEESGHDARWEFSRSLLFDNANYAGQVCGELLGMLEAVDDFCKFLGPELKAVTGDDTVVDEVARMVQAMIAPVEGVSFNVLDKARSMEWKGIRLRFGRDADDIKLATRDLIDTCFRKLRSVEAAAHVLQSFEQIQTQGAIQRQMTDKLTDVLEHFIREVHSVHKNFEDNKDSPPISRNMPPVAGAIRWARGLFGRVKRTLGKLQSLQADLEAMETGQKALAACKDLAKAMLQYEKACYETWRSTAEQIATSSLQQPVLAKEQPPEDAYSSAGAGTGTERIIINFAPALLRLIREAKYLDQLGFSIPEVAVNTALQERRFRQHIEELRDMLQHYYRAVEGLHSAERALLVDHLARLEGVLSPALTRMNWNSLSISDFAATANKAIDEFEALVSQITKNTHLLEVALAQIARGALVPSARGVQSLKEAQGASSSEGGSGVGAAAEPPVPDMGEFYEDYEQHRLQAVDRLVQIYRSCTPLLCKIEELVVGSNSGKSPKLAGYYAYWERRVFGAVTSMVLNAIDAVHTRLKDCTSATEAGSASKPPVLMVTLSLIHPEVVLTPSTGEVTKQMVRLLRNLAESSKAFIRWMDGTCLECEPQYVNGDDSEPFTFSFFQDISQHPAVIKSMLSVNHTVQKATTLVNKFVEGYRGYNPLWKADRAALLAKFKARRPTHAAFVQRLSQYARVIEDVQGMRPVHDVDFVRINCSPLLESMKEEAATWLRGLAGIMREQEAPVKQAWEELLHNLQHVADLVPGSEEEVERIKESLASILASAAAAEEAFAELEERARTRLLHDAGAEAGEFTAELQAASALRLAWQQLAGKAALRQQQPIVAAVPAEGPSATSSADAGVAAPPQEGDSIGPPKTAEKEQ